MTKIAIVGGTDSWKDAPYDDKSWKVWVLANQLTNYHNKRIDRIFEIHNDPEKVTPEFAKWVVDFDFPTIVGEGFPVKADNVQVFDFAKAKELAQGNFLTSTPAYMIAQAIMDYPDLEEVGLWGIDMAVDDREYFYEQPCIQRWLGILIARGVKVTLPDGCPLGEPAYMEGVTGNKPKGPSPYTEDDFLELAADHQKAINDLEAQIAKCQGLIQTHGGAMQAYTRMAKVARATDAGQVFGNLKQTVRMIK